MGWPAVPARLPAPGVPDAVVSGGGKSMVKRAAAAKARATSAVLESGMVSTAVMPPGGEMTTLAEVISAGTTKL